MDAKIKEKMDAQIKEKMDIQVEKTLTDIGDWLNWILFVFLSSFLVMWLWNWLMPQLFSLSLINFWQALGINTLSHILFQLNYRNSKK